MDFYDTHRDDVKVCVQRSRSCTVVSLAFEQRPGVWHLLDNFPNDPLYAEMQEYYGIELTCARSDVTIVYTPEELATIFATVR